MMRLLVQRARLHALLKAAQLSLFGRPKMRQADSGGQKKDVQVKAHARVTKQGKVATVQAHTQHRRAAAPKMPKARPGLAAKHAKLLQRAAALANQEGITLSEARAKIKAGAAEKPPAKAKRAPATRGQKLMAWFGDSKVRKADGTPQEEYGHEPAPATVYHGTPVGGFRSFSKDKDKGHNIFGRGFYFTEDRAIAEEYTKKDADTADSGATGWLDKDGNRITHMTHKAATLVAEGFRGISIAQDGTVDAGGHGINPNWGPHIAVALDASREGKRYNLDRFLHAFWSAHESDRTHQESLGIKYPIHSQPGAQGGQYMVRAVRSALHKTNQRGAKLQIPDSEVKEVFLKIENPIDMDAPVSKEALEDFSRYVRDKQLKSEHSQTASYEKKTREDAQALEWHKQGLNPYSGEKLTALDRQHAFWSTEDLEARLKDSQEYEANHKARIARLEGMDHGEAWMEDMVPRDMRPDPRSGMYPIRYADLLKLKQHQVDATRGHQHRGRQVMGILHITDPATLTWGDVHYLTSEGHQQYDMRSHFTSWAQKAGHDGIRHTGGWNIGTKPHTVWIAWEPNQVKATSSEGFDPSTDDMYKGTSMRLIIRLTTLRALLKAAQMNLFGGETKLPPEGNHHTVKAHTRVTQHGTVHVPRHERRNRGGHALPLTHRTPLHGPHPGQVHKVLVDKPATPSSTDLPGDSPPATTREDDMANIPDPEPSATDKRARASLREHLFNKPEKKIKREITIPKAAHSELEVEQEGVDEDYDDPSIVAVLKAYNPYSKVLRVPRGDAHLFWDGLNKLSNAADDRAEDRSHSKEERKHARAAARDLTNMMLKVSPINEHENVLPSEVMTAVRVGAITNAKEFEYARSRIANRDWHSEDVEGGQEDQASEVVEQFGWEDFLGQWGPEKARTAWEAAQRLRGSIETAVRPRVPELADMLADDIRRQFEYLKKVAGPDFAKVDDYDRATWKLRQNMERFASFPNAAKSGFRRERGEAVLNEAKVKAFSASAAEQVLGELKDKMVAKLGGLDDAKAIGHTHDHFTLEGTRGGRKVRVEQRIILNVSKLGTLFNQFPARIYVDGKQTSAADFKGLAG